MSQATNHTDTDKVADAIRHSWVYFLPKWLWPFAQLARWERPIGWQLLMWPCMWSVMLALIDLKASASVDHPVSAVFMMFLLPMLLGAMLMRGAGCTYNDLADVDIDEKVERTRSRPLPSGRVSRKQAWLFLVLQSLAGLCVLLFLSRNSIFVFWVGAASLLTVAVYPFMKRITWWPQLFLGFAFSWGALMGWTAVRGELALAPVLLYLGCIFWVIGYDTIYAHQDREDDALVGVKSTARLFGTQSKPAIFGLYAAAFLIFAASWYLSVPLGSSWSWPAWAGLVLVAAHMIWQIAALDIDNPDQCLRLFKSNSILGLILFAGLLSSYVIS